MSFQLWNRCLNNMNSWTLVTIHWVITIHRTNCLQKPLLLYCVTAPPCIAAICHASRH